MPPDVSIVICTRDRADDLAQTLRAIEERCGDGPFSVEVLVVDNASVDATAEVVRKFAPGRCNVRYVHEARKGQGNARNRGIAEARGAIILFTDDDVRPPADWVERMCAPIAKGRADAVAGAIEIAPPLQREWMTPFHRVCLASTDALNPAAIETMTGGNFAFSRAVLERVPGFDPELGPGALGFCDDVLFSLQLVRAGYRLVAVFDSPVMHYFDVTRLSRSSFVRRAEAEGRSRAYLAHHWEHRVIAWARLRTCAAYARLQLRRLNPIGRWPQEEGIAEWEFHSILRLHFRRQFLRESRRPRRYAPYGLRLDAPNQSSL